MSRFKRRSVWAVILTLLAVTVPAAVQADTKAAIEGVDFMVGTADGVFIKNTSSILSKTIATLPVAFRVSGPDAPANVGIIQIKIDYPADQLEYMGWSVGSYWSGDYNVGDSDPAGSVTIYLDSAVLPAPTDYTTLVNLQFTPLCQEELTEIPVTIDFDPIESFIIYNNTKYYDEGDPSQNGAVIVADYDGYLSIIDPDPLDGDDVTLELQGVVETDTIIDVPFYLSTNANIKRIQVLVDFDATRLQPVDYVPETGCNNWVWSYGSPPTDTGGQFYVDLINYPMTGNDTGLPCKYMTVKFRVLGIWPGDETVISYDPGYRMLQVGTDGCGELTDAYSWYNGTVAIDPYQATLQTVVNDYIWDVPGQTSKIFTAVVEAANTFTMGGATDEAVRILFDLGPDMNILNLYQPDIANPDPNNPLDDFWFDYTTESAKSPNQYLNLLSRYKSELVNRRGPTADMDMLIQMDLIQQNVAAPATFGPHPASFSYACRHTAGNARILDAVTDSLQADCDNENLIFSDLPHIDYATAELSCEERSSTQPADVVQEYWVRTTFPLVRFQVTVNKSGPHNIVGVDPAEGVEVVAQGYDFVTFGPAADWTPDIFDTRRLLGTITYNNNVNITPTGNLDKDIAPPTKWCWTYTDISFDHDSQLDDGTDSVPFKYFIENRIGTRRDCSVGLPDSRLKSDTLPKTFALRGNYPNPFNPQTRIAFDVPSETKVSMEIMDVRGRRILTLLDETMEPGRHEVVWNGRDQNGRPVSSGTYFYRMKAGEVTLMGSMILLK